MTTRATEQMRKFWHRDTLEAARDDLVTSPPNPARYQDDVQAGELHHILGLEPCGRILDYGCGIGRVTRALLRAGCQVTAVDVSPSMLEHCRTYCRPHYPQTMLCDGYGCLSLESEAYDGALCLYVLQHAPDQDVIRETLATLQRAMKPGGWLVVQTTEHGQAADGGMLGVPCSQETIYHLTPRIDWRWTWCKGSGEIYMGGWKEKTLRAAPGSA